MKRIISLLTVLGLSITWNNIAAGAAGASATVTVTGGAITAISVSSGGSEYTTAPSVFILDTGGGSDASATATVSDGAVTGVTVTDGGSGYSSSSTVQVIFLPNIDDLGEPPEETPTDPPTDTPDTSSLPDEPEGSPEEGTPDSRFLGISTRGPVTATSFLHAGIAINGSDAKTVIFMAKGPLLANYGVSGVLSDPVIEIYDVTGAMIYSNDSWGDPAGNQNLSVYDGQPGITLPVDAAEAGLAVTLNPGAYTAIVKGANGSEGIALVEAYEVSGETPNTSFLGISTRGPVTATSYMHAGIAIEGTVAKKVAFMAKGPLLANYGVSGVLSDPVIEIYDVTGAMIYSNDSWGDATGDQNISAYDGKAGITQPVNVAEAAIVVTLDPGAYTAIMKGANGSEGIALVEAYEISE